METPQIPYHVPVMLQEALEGLNISSEGTYVDVTFGGGGHSRAIMDRLEGGKLIAFDQDADAKANAEEIACEKLVFVEANFRYLKKYLRLNGFREVDGILADLGVSSHHFDQAERGFSIRLEGSLDMRMDANAEPSAFHVINEYEEEAISNILWYYGEVKKARTVAKAIVNARSVQPIETTTQLKNILENFAPRGKENKFYAQVFQAIRIEVNDELEALKSMLNEAVEVLKPGGRLVIMSYHSLEDRLVKHFVKAGNYTGEQTKDMYGNLLRPFKPIVNKAIQASEEEIANNNRARSARLRIAERTDFSPEMNNK